MYWRFPAKTALTGGSYKSISILFYNLQNVFIDACVLEIVGCYGYILFFGLFVIADLLIFWPHILQGNCFESNLPCYCLFIHCWGALYLATFKWCTLATTKWSIFLQNILWNIVENFILNNVPSIDLFKILIFPLFQRWMIKKLF